MFKVEQQHTGGFVDFASKQCTVDVSRTLSSSIKVAMAQTLLFSEPALINDTPYKRNTWYEPGML